MKKLLLAGVFGALLGAQGNLEAVCRRCVVNRTARLEDIEICEWAPAEPVKKEEQKIAPAQQTRAKLVDKLPESKVKVWLMAAKKKMSNARVRLATWIAAVRKKIGR